MSTKLYTIGAASRARYDNKPWKVRLEYEGRNYDNASGRSCKFWEGSAVGDGNVLIRWGKLGARGGSQTKTWSEFCDKLHKKLNHRKTPYEYADGTLRTYTSAPAKPAAPALPALTGPFALVRWLRQAADLSWECLDDTEAVLFTVPAGSAQTLVRYPDIKVKGSVELGILG